jgi:hypothetical protein
MIEDSSPLDKMTTEEMNSLVQSIKKWVDENISERSSGGEGA